MNKLLTEKQIEILVNTVEKELNVTNLKYEIIGREILFYKNGIYFAYFNLDEIQFNDSNLEIHSSPNNNLYNSVFFQKIHKSYQKYIKDIDKYFSGKLSKATFVMNELKYQTLCEKFVSFINDMPYKYLNSEQHKIKNDWKLSLRYTANKSNCPFCNTHSFICNDDGFECLICRNKFSYKHQFNFCKMTKPILAQLFNWDFRLGNFFQNKKLAYQFIVAATLSETYGYNLLVTDFTKSMIRYKNAGFDVTDDDGNVHTFFFLMNSTNFLYFNNKNYLENYWKYQLRTIENKIITLTKKYPNKKFSILYIDKPEPNTGINTILAKRSYKNILKKINDDMYDKFENLNYFSKYSNLERIELFTNFSLNHYVIGLRELSYSLLRFIFGSLDLKLHTFNNQDCSFKFNGPQHGFMELILNELDEIDHFEKIDMLLHTYDYSISSTGLFKKTWIMKYALGLVEPYFKKVLAKLKALNFALKDETFKKTS